MLMGLVKGKAATEAGCFVESGRGNIRVLAAVAPLNDELDEKSRVNVLSSDWMSKGKFKYRVQLYFLGVPLMRRNLSRNVPRQRELLNICYLVRKY